MNAIQAIEQIGFKMAQAMKELAIPVCPVLQGGVQAVEVRQMATKAGVALQHLTISPPTVIQLTADETKKIEPTNVAVVFSGGPASGGHNIVAGIRDYLEQVAPGSRIFGFTKGPSGLIKGKGKWLDNDIIDEVVNTGGFDMKSIMGTSRTKLRTSAEKIAANEKSTTDDFESSYEVLQKLGIQTVIFVGGDDTNTNAAFLANFLKGKNSSIGVIGVPKTIDGDLQNWPELELSFGFHTATRIYAEYVGNLANDAKSSLKYWNFVKLMGRAASWVTLETALQTQPNITLIGEEIKAKQMTLQDVVDYMVKIIVQRSQAGKNYGVALIPEGVIDFIPEMNKLIEDIKKGIHKIGVEEFMKIDPDERETAILYELGEKSEKVLKILPHEIKMGLLSGIDESNNIKLSQIPTEKLFMLMCQQRLKAFNKGEIKIEGIDLTEKIKMDDLGQFYGYEGRCGYPTWFDATYTKNLGRLAAALAVNGYSGYMATISGLTKPVDQWQLWGLPLAGLIHEEKRGSKTMHVIEKALIDTQTDPAYLWFAAKRDAWALDDKYIVPGPIQYFGSDELVQDRPLILQIKAQAQQQGA